MRSILEALRERVLVADGAMGTMLYAAGIQPDVCYERLVLDRPALVERIHRDYLAAGADIIETNTFSANALHLARFGCAAEVRRINTEAVRLARTVAGDRAFVAGSVGPLDGTAPGSALSGGDVRDVYREQIAALAEAGVDLFMLETFSRLEHLAAAVSVCKEHTGIPVFAQMTFPDGVRTSAGTGIEEACAALIDRGADGIGTNCGSGPAAMRGVVARIAALTGRPVSALPNAGYPEAVDGRLMYLTSPAYFARQALLLIEAGASIVGGCCGTTPEHIRLTARAVGRRAPCRPRSVPERTATVTVPAEPARVPTGVETIVELLPPRQADMGKVVDAAVMFRDVGVRTLTFPENPLARVRMSAIAAAAIVQRQTGLESIFHYTCRDRNVIGLQSGLLGAYALGLRQVLAVTGDPASSGGTLHSSSVFDLDSVRLVGLIDGLKRSMGLSLRVGVAFNPNPEEIQGNVKRLKRKIDAGAEFIMTQPVFDAEKVERLREAVKGLGIPVYLGILPLTSRKTTEYLHNEVPGISIPTAIRARMATDDEVAAEREGLAIAAGIMRQASCWVAGFYLMSPAHKYTVTARLVKENLSSLVGHNEKEGVHE